LFRSFSANIIAYNDTVAAQSNDDVRSNGARTRAYQYVKCNDGVPKRNIRSCSCASDGGGDVCALTLCKQTSTKKAKYIYSKGKKS